MTALAAVIPSSRRISAGITPGPGATSRLPAWWGRADWIADVSTTAACHGDLLRAHHVSLDAVVATARAMAAYADNATGRDCRPTNERVVAASRFSLSVIQRARRVLKALGFVVETIRGRSMMTRAERLAAWRRGSSHRRLAATFALCSRSPRLHLLGPRRAPKGRATQREIPPGSGFAHPHPVERDTPPGEAWARRNLPLRRSSLRRPTASEEGGCAAAGNAGGDDRPRRLAAAVRSRLGWLAGVQLGRLVPTLTRLARAGWTAEDVALAARDARAALGWSMPGRLDQPAAYLARLLRSADPADRPSVTEAAYAAAMAERAAAERAARRLHVLTSAGKCPHGVPGSGAGQPARGVPACQDCAQ